MGRLIDADALKEEWKEGFHKKIVEALLDDAPTVEAIPKADYENRLKADMVAMLEELKEQLREMHEDFFETEHFDEAYGVSDSMDVIQEKINELKGDNNEQK
jgi:hypothetical protein